ncbi:MAG: ATP-binding protein [Candidatus Hodarchaeota archaeon]
MPKGPPEDEGQVRPAPVLLAPRIGTITPILPPWSAEKEIGYVLAAGAKDAVRIGEETHNSVLCLIPIRHRTGLRLGDPVCIWDYVEGEVFGGVIAEISLPNITREHLETYLFEEFVPTQELVAVGSIDFLEQPAIITVKLFCTLEPKTWQKGPVDYTPHPRASLFRPGPKLVQKMFGLAKSGEGICYGVILLGRQPYKFLAGENHGLVDIGTENKVVEDQDSQLTYFPYIMREHLLYEHEFSIGTTGKGKTVRNKNDVNQWIDKLRGAVVILDKHGEYIDLGKSLVNPPDQTEQTIWKDCSFQAAGLKDLKIFKWAPRLPEEPNKKVEYFTVRLGELENSDLCYYLPELTPQGYTVLPRLIGFFKRESGLFPTLANFERWLRRVDLPESVADQRTVSAVLRRLAMTLESRIFDGLDLEDIPIQELIQPGRVSVIPLNHILDDDVVTNIAFHVLNKLARYKLSGQDKAKIPVMILVDEAHNYFPRFVDPEQRAFIKRLIRRAKTICKEGRKFQLRLQFTTQRPEEIDIGVLSIVNTITFFGCTPQQVSSLKKAIELPISPNQLINLPKRTSIIYSKDNTDAPVTVLVPWPTLRHPVRV